VPPPTGPLQASLIGSFEAEFKEQLTRVVCPIILEQTYAAIASRITEIAVEFAKKKGGQ
jgi:hypothetical protein